MQPRGPVPKRIGGGASSPIYWADSSTSRTTSNVPHGFGMNVVRELLSYPGARKSVSKAIPVV